MTIAPAPRQLVDIEPAPIHDLTLEEFEKASDQAVALANSGRVTHSEAEDKEPGDGIHLPANWQVWAACAAMVLMVVAIGYGVLNFPA